MVTGARVVGAAAATDEFWDRVYRRREDIVTREVAGETILVPIRGTLSDLQKVYTLNAVGAEVWRLIDGVRTLGDIRSRVLDLYEAPPERVEPDLREFVAHVLDEGLVSDADGGTGA